LKVSVPPIKSQGIKTKLVSWIDSFVPKEFDGRWIEPFMGTGVVGFNVTSNEALMCDVNPHMINFYHAIESGDITPKQVREYLNYEGSILLDKGDEYYYEVRERFNKDHHPLDFLFLNRAGFNGMIRFNRSGQFNIPFCKKPERFSKSYVTKIVNQVANVSQVLKTRKFTFVCQTFQETIAQANYDDIIYCDPPYINRHVDYYNGWDNSQEQELFKCLSQSKAKFILSTWHHNDFRKNEYIELLWNKFSVHTREHFYHVGAKEKNRNPVVEAIITNC